MTFHWNLLVCHSWCSNSCSSQLQCCTFVSVNFFMISKTFFQTKHPSTISTLKAPFNMYLYMILELFLLQINGYIFHIQILCKVWWLYPCDISSSLLYNICCFTSVTCGIDVMPCVTSYISPPFILWKNILKKMKLIITCHTYKLLNQFCYKKKFLNYFHTVTLGFILLYKFYCLTFFSGCNKLK